jgi:hypothetical protein
MAIFEISKETIVRVPMTTFAAQGFKERQDLQRLLRDNINVIAPETYVLAEEYGEWEDAKRRIDLLGIDKQANLIVIELKRTEDGGHMELQAIRYAAMVGKMTYDQAVEAHANYLLSVGSPADADSAIRNFLDWDDPQKNEFAQDVHIVLVSGEFSKEITTSVMWLNERDLNIRCVRLRPYVLGEKTLVDIQQVIPLPEATEYQVKLKQKAAEQRQSIEGGADWTRYDLNISGQLFPNLYKRKLFFLAIQALISNGVTPDKLKDVFPEKKFLSVSGTWNSSEFVERVREMKNADGNPYNLRRYYVADGELFHVNGSTYALTNQWSKKRLPGLDQLIAKYPEAAISYTESNEE